WRSGLADPRQQRGLLREGDALSAGPRPAEGVLPDRAAGRREQDPGEGDGQGVVARKCVGVSALSPPRAPRRADRRCAVGGARSRPQAAADAGSGEAGAPRGESPPASDRALRGSPLDRLQDTGGARDSGRERSEPSGSASPELSSRIPARLEQQELLRAAPARPALA